MNHKLMTITFAVLALVTFALQTTEKAPEAPLYFGEKTSSQIKTLQQLHPELPALFGVVPSDNEKVMGGCVGNKRMHLNTNIEDLDENTRHLMIMHEALECSKRS